MKSLPLLLFFVFSLVGSYLRRNADEIKVHPITNLSDWRNTPFQREITSEVEILGLGEFTHGCTEVFSVKASLAQYLVYEKGFDAIIIEYPNILLKRINDYLQSDTIMDRHAEDLLFSSCFFGSYKNRDLADFIHWIKKANQSLTKKIVLKGIDANARVFPSNRYLIERYLLPNFYSSSEEILNLIGKQSDLYVFNKIKSIIERNPNARLTNLTGEQLLELKLDLRSAEAAYMLQSKTKERTYSRDSIMSENVNDIAKYHRSILWAHNLHLMKGTHPHSNQQNLGEYLKASFGTRYYSILTDFSTAGDVTVYSDNDYTTQRVSAKKRSLGYILASRQGHFPGLIVLKSDFLNPYYVVNLNTIDLAGRHFLASQKKGSEVNFNAVIVLKDISPSQLKQ